ncbi:hypothetical protein [Actinomadura sp. HBU206391]|uniref:hypothetical protein n=1 Tax=Actinomadura sp. HBU206391 TaxID=2731692 RepID=UPI00164FD292|nr:hypothetical protein [Actinomadura sp. HBU206391]MBC6459209.1 hypothetical protein [Actinomadura sp. HBU206391]
MFAPFPRLCTDRSGSAQGAGLGLSIVRAVVRAHDGVAEAVPRRAAAWFSPSGRPWAGRPCHVPLTHLTAPPPLRERRAPIRTRRHQASPRT